MYQFFFTKERDNVTAMEYFLTSVFKTGTRLTSKRPEAMAIKENQLSKLMLYLMKKKGGRSLTEHEFISYWGPRVYLSMFNRLCKRGKYRNKKKDSVVCVSQRMVIVFVRTSD